jgi:CRISPR-associated protein Cmr2
MTVQYFHFSLAPVQGFIAQARRTRDFWTGSFILSWLAAVAMLAVQKQGGEIIFPKPDDDYLLWIENGDGKSKNPPKHGGVPNRFKAKVSKDFEPQVIVNAVKVAWQGLADKVFNGDFMTASPSKDWQSSVTKQLWDEQVETFWDMSWVLLDEDNAAALDVRKNWRSYLPPKQAGVKCMVMEGWQELSGEVRPGEEVRKFWQKVRNNPEVKGMKTDLREGEQLCAMAFIKRRFPRYFNENLVVDMPNGWTLKGWQVEAGRPSVAYMAAIHWLKLVLKTTTNDEIKNKDEIAKQLWRFHDIAVELTDGKHNEWDNQIQCITDCNAPKKWQGLDGNVFFESALENANIYPDQAQAKQVLKELKHLQALLRDTIKPPSPFYAVLMMDGDSLGKQMSDEDKQETITQGLKTFTDSVPDLVRLHNGFLIYAGGDDVLALLPLEDALSCALAVRQKYECVFADLNQKIPKEKQVFTSISAAVLFVNTKMPLTKVLKTAHHLLDDVAKDQYGRDSLAVSVWKPGGEVLKWARPWDKAIENKQLVMERLAKQFASDDESGQFSNRFLYKIRERFELLNPEKDKKDPTKKRQPVLSDAQAIDLMAAEYVSSSLGKIKIAHAKAIITPLLEQCRPIFRDEQKPDNPEEWERGVDVLVDAALLIRFLAQHGVNL